MPYLLSEQSAEWLRAQKSRAGDLRSRRREFRQNGGDVPIGDPHLVVRINTVQSNPVQPASAWTLDGRVVPLVGRIRVYAMALADVDGPYTVVGNGRCIAHRVRGLAGEIREGL